MKVFIDTSILIEYLKGNQIDLYEELFKQPHSLYINQVVISEFLFNYIKVISNKSPMTVKQSRKIAEVFGKLNPLEMFPGCIHLNHTVDIANKGFELMKRYNLLPNDAIIIATCIQNNIENLASYDSDFKIVSNTFGIRLLSNVEDFNNIPRINFNRE